MSAGKGDKPRKVDGDKFRANYEGIFRKGKAFVDQYHPDTVKLRDHSKHSKKKPHDPDPKRPPSDR